MPSVVLLHAWWGRTPAFLAMADALRAEGYEVAVPDLYGDGRTASSIPEARALLESLRWAPAVARARAAREGLPGPVAVMGFSLGVAVAVELLLTDPSVRAAVLYYGSRPVPEDARVGAAVLGHLAGHDEWEPEDEVRALTDGLVAAGARAEFHTYPGTGHWFAEPDRPEHDPAAAALAWSRTLAFLRAELGA